MVEPERLHQDLVRWGVIEPDAPIRFTRRFRGALARAAADLQASQASGNEPLGDPLANQVQAALDAFLDQQRNKPTAAHYTFIRAVHLQTLPEAVRHALGL